MSERRDATEKAIRKALDGTNGYPIYLRCLNGMMALFDALESPAEAKPDIGLECERCCDKWVGESIFDALKLGWTILNQRVDYLCPSCSKPKPDADVCEYCGRSDMGCQPGVCEGPLAHKDRGPGRIVPPSEIAKPKPDADSAGEVEGLVRIFRGILWPGVETAATVRRTDEAARAALDFMRKRKPGYEEIIAERDKALFDLVDEVRRKAEWKSRAELAEFERDGWIKRYEVVKGQVDALKEELRAESAASSEEIVRLNELIRKGAKATEGGP